MNSSESMKRSKWEKLVERRSDFWKNYMMIVSLQEVKKIFGFTLQEHLTTREGMNFTHWISLQSVRRFSLQIEHEIQKNTRFIGEILHIFEVAQRNLLSINERLKDTDFASLADQKLRKIFHEFCEQYLALYPGFHIGIYTSTIEEKVKRWLLKQLKSTNQEEKLNDYFIQLTAPERPSLIQEEERELLNIVLKIKKKVTTKKTKKFLVDEHVAKYAGLPVINDEISPWNRSYFTRRLTVLLKKPLTQLQEQYQYICHLPTETKKTKVKIYQLFFTPERIRQLFYFIGQTTWIRLVGRNTFALAHHASRPLFEEIGRRHHLSFKEVKWLTVPEIDNLIAHDILPPNQKIEERKKTSLLLFRNGRIVIKEGEEAKRQIKKELGSQLKKQIEESLRGSVAYPGKVRGKVKIIITQKNLQKMRKGDILITRMTTVELLSAIRKASAIVTDEGGITCHAAIVSREFKIPCIVGTKFATKVLKDDDIVEIDANQGIIKFTK